MISSPPDFALRPARQEDAQAVLELIPSELAFGLDDIRNEWRRTDLARDTWAWERNGRLAAFGILRSRGDELSVNGFVHPDFRGRGLGTAILRATEARARERGGTQLDNGILAADRVAAALLEANGYRDVRHYYVMTIELDGPPPEPEWPEGLVPRPFEREHARALLLRVFGQFYERGERRVSLNVHTENPTGATRLYESVGMHVEREEILYQKELVVVRGPVDA